MKPVGRSAIRAAKLLARSGSSRLASHVRPQCGTDSSRIPHRRMMLGEMADIIPTSPPRRWMSANAVDSSKASEDDGTKWMYVFAGLMVGANFFTVWQESDAHDKAEQRAAEYEANKRAWEERERRESQQLKARQMEERAQARAEAAVANASGSTSGPTDNDASIPAAASAAKAWKVKLW